MKKKLLFTAFLTALFAVVNAQSNFGVDYFSIGEYQKAKQYFESNVSKTPAESNYYLGEIAFAEGKMDEAKSYFDKGVAADPLYTLNQVGQGKLILKTDAKAAESLFAAALKKNKKSPVLNVTIARAYWECGLNDGAQLKLVIAKKYGKKSPLVYTLEGDMLKAENKMGEAAAKYEQALNFDTSFVVASIKCAQIYESINPNLSLEILKKVLASHPDYTIAYKGLGRTYMLNGQYLSAIEGFKAYVADGGILNVDDYIKFASCYYFTDQFELSNEEVNSAIKLDSTNFVLNRFRVWNAAKLDDAVNGLKYADYFFTLKSEIGFIPNDYMAYASILALNGLFDDALKIYDKLMETDSERPEIYKELFGVYQKMGDNVKASDTYKKFMDLTGADYVSSMDYFKLARSYYSAGVKLKADTTSVDNLVKAKEYLLKADSTFAIVCKMTPESYTGFIWRGHTNSSIEKVVTEGLAKPYYETAIEMINAKLAEKPGNGYNTDLIRAYTYLGLHYLYLDDDVNSAKYWNKVLELDPTNKNAKMVLDEQAAKKAAKK